MGKLAHKVLIDCNYEVCKNEDLCTWIIMIHNTCFLCINIKNLSGTHLKQRERERCGNDDISDTIKQSWLVVFFCLVYNRSGGRIVSICLDV